MRCVVLILVTLQLLLNGVAHSHFHADSQGAAGQMSRPHLHLAGHSHEHHGHSHSHEDEDPARNDATESLDLEHDHDAVYLSLEIVTMSGVRAWAPGLDVAMAISLESCTTQLLFEMDRTPCRDDGPSGAGARARRMPHQLRV